MSNEKMKQFIQQGFDTVAQGYDHPALSFFPETAKRMVQHLQPGADQHWLDVCTGTGVVALAAADQVENGRVVGIDLSNGMLEQARHKAQSKKLHQVEFHQMDLDHLSFDEASFDVASSSFGLFFLEDMVKALSNISHCVKPGGKVVFSTFTGDAFAPMSDLFIKHYEETGRQIPPLSWRRLATPELIGEHFSAVGIENFDIHHEPLGYKMTDAGMWWDVLWNAGWRSFLNQLNESELALFKQQHLAEIDRLIDEAGDDGLWFNTEVLIAVGHKNT